MEQEAHDEKYAHALHQLEVERNTDAQLINTLNSLTPAHSERAHGYRHRNLLMVPSGMLLIDDVHHFLVRKCSEFSIAFWVLLHRFCPVQILVIDL